MLIYRGDQRLHQPPEGWSFANPEPDAQVESLDAELWVLHETRTYDIADLLPFRASRSW